MGGLISAFYMCGAVSRRPFVSAFDNNFKIVTDAAVMITFNVSVMLNVGNSMTKEFLPDGFLNFVLICVNIFIPGLVVVHQLLKNMAAKRKRKAATTRQHTVRAAHKPTRDEPTPSSKFTNPLGVDESSDEEG